MRSILPLFVILGATVAAAPPPPAETSIPFANRSIDDWRVVDRETLLIRANRNWYRATLMGPCTELPFALAIGFDSGVGGRFDRFSKLIVGNETCQLNSLVRSDPPPPKVKRAK
jgi:hypothetical protein